jgi:hypothetical protein
MNPFFRPALAKWLGGATLALFAFGLFFRFAVYRHMYIGPEDPYGISDVIEFLLGCVLLAALAVSVLGAVALAVKGPRKNRVAAAWLFGTCISVVVLLVPLHNLAAKLAP